MGREQVTKSVLNIYAIARIVVMLVAEQVVSKRIYRQGFHMDKIDI
jgi:hypothetical protein